MSGGDPHSPTTAGPTPAPPPSPTVPAAEATPAPPAGSVAAPVSEPAPAAAQGDELPFGIPPEHPEILVGAAFAGGLLAAFILKRLGGH